jgi:hypothetical protein
MSVLIPGDTCWRLAHARRAAFIVDTEAYFTAVVDHPVGLELRSALAPVP